MAPRFYFLCPDTPHASGGVAVIYDSVQALTAAGHEAFLLHERPGYRYPGSPHQPPTRYSDWLAGLRARRQKPHARLIYRGRSVLNTLRADDCRVERFEPDDVLVVPEYMWADAAAAFPGQPLVVFSQNPFSYLASFVRAKGMGIDPDADVVHTLVVSDSCEEAARLVSRKSCSRVTVGPNLGLFAYQAIKTPQIAYMPRKRPAEAALLRLALEQRQKMAGFTLLAIERMSQARVAAAVRDSLIFVSLMDREGLGFPGIEAMSAGCLVIGYTGLAAREYFDRSTGIPIEEGDTAGLVRAIEDAVAEYRADPGRIDALRKHASDTVGARYGQDRFVASLTAAWERIGQSLAAGAAAGRARRIGA